MTVQAHYTAQADAIIRDIERLSTLVELKAVNQALGRRWRELQGAASREVLANFHVGQHVEFTGRRGALLRGVIESINIRTVTVEVTHENGRKLGLPVTWRVAPSYLRTVEGKGAKSGSKSTSVRTVAQRVAVPDADADEGSGGGRSSKYAPAQVAEVKKRRGAQETIADIAEAMRIPKGSVYGILNGRITGGE